MSALVPFSPGQLPAHIAEAFGTQDNIPDRITLPTLSYRGKVWRLVLQGKETILTRKDPDTGEAMPAPIVNVVVLDFHKKRGRAFYEGAFEEDKKTAPICRSADGEKPDADVKKPCAPTCAACPNSVKGSKISENGKQTTACTPYKMLAVVPSAKLDMEPLRLRLAQTSMWDKEASEQNAQGWYAWDQYVDFLRQHGVKHTATVSTSIKFDATTAYPKLLFKVAGWLPAESAGPVKAALANPSIPKLLNMTTEIAEPAEPEGEVEAASSVPAPAPAPVAPPAAPKKPGRPKAPPAPAPAPAPVQAADDDGGFGAIEGLSGAQVAAAKAPVAPPPAAKPAAAPAATGELESILGGWDD